MDDIPHPGGPGSVRRLFPSSASAMAVYTNADGDVVIRHRDALEDSETLVVIPPAFAARLAQAIDRAARGTGEGLPSGAGAVA